MEKTEKNNFLIFLKYKNPAAMRGFFYPLFYALYPAIHCNPPRLLRQDKRISIAIRARELVETALTFINYNKD
jgi:hypothetical protein